LAVAIRLTRVGATKRPAYRVIAIDKRRLILEQSDQYWDRANVKSPTVEMVVNENLLT
jgi:ABC-type oligopeptide transport system substrate-binding subunit